MTEAQDFLDEVIKKFPYSARSDQLKLLAEFFVTYAGSSPKEVHQELEISYETQRKMRSAWRDLSQKEHAFLLSQFSTVLYHEQC
jgi:hypothetical protein